MHSSAQSAHEQERRSSANCSASGTVGASSIIEPGNRARILTQSDLHQERRKADRDVGPCPGVEVADVKLDVRKSEQQERGRKEVVRSIMAIRGSEQPTHPAMPTKSVIVVDFDEEILYREIYQRDLRSSLCHKMGSFIVVWPENEANVFGRRHGLCPKCLSESFDVILTI